MSFYHQIVQAQVSATDVATTVIPINTDLGGETPKAIIVTAIGRAATTGQGTSAVRWSRGFATGPTSRGSISAYSDFSGAASDMGRARRNASVISEVDGAAVRGELDLQSFVADGCNLIVDVQFTVDHTLVVELFAGDEITNATVIPFTKSASGVTGPRDVTTPGFPVRYVEQIGVATADANLATSFFPAFGRATPLTGENQGWTAGGLDNVATSNTGSFCDDTRFIVTMGVGSAAPTYEASVTAQISTGFTINEVVNTSSSTRIFSFLCLGGTFNVKLGSFETFADTTSVAQPAPGFIVTGAVYTSHCLTESTTGAGQDGAELSMGWLQNQRSELAARFQLAMAFNVQDNSATQNSTAVHVSLGDDTDALYINLDAAGAIEGQMMGTIVSGAVPAHRMTDADPTARFILYAYFGPASAGTGKFVVDEVVFSTTTAVATTTIDIALPNLAAHDLAPVIVWAMVVGKTGVSTLELSSADVKLSYGFAVSTTSRRCAGGSIQTNVNPSNVNSTWRNDALVYLTTTAGGTDGALDVNNMSTAGMVQLIIDDAFAASYTVILKAWAGTDISAATIVDATLANAGALNVTTVGHATRYLESIFPGVSAINAIENNSSGFSIGRSFVPSLANQVVVVRSDDNRTPSQSGSYANDVECVALLSNAGVPNMRAACTGSLSNGFSLNIIEAFAGFDTFKQGSFLAVNGTFKAALGAFDTPTDATIVELEPGFVPVSSEFWSHNLAESTTDTGQAGAQMSLGWTLGQFGAAQLATGFNDTDNVNPTTTESWIAPNATEGLAYVNTDGVSGLEGAGGLIYPGAPDTNGTMSWQMTLQPDPSPFRVMWAAFGESVVGMSSAVMSSGVRGYFFKALRGKR